MGSAIETDLPYLLLAAACQNNAPAIAYGGPARPQLTAAARYSPNASENDLM
jgi:hypothetical protein